MIHDGHLGELLVVKNLENFPVDFMVVSKLPSSDTPVIPRVLGNAGALQT